MGAPMSSFSVDDPAKAFLSQDDFTAVSFWIISIAMIATTVFLYAEASTVVGHWKTSVHVGGLVTLVAAVHYMYMREYWVAVKASPIIYRYIDWTITVPLQMIEFNLIIKAAGGKIGPAGFWKLLVGTVVMLCFGYFGETNKDNMPLRDLLRRGRRTGQGCQPRGGVFFQHHALHCHRWLGHLPCRLLLRLPPGQRE